MDLDKWDKTAHSKSYIVDTRVDKKVENPRVELPRSFSSVYNPSWPEFPSYGLNPTRPEFPKYGLNPTRKNPKFQDMGSTQPEKTRKIWAQPDPKYQVSGQLRVNPIFILGTIHKQIIWVHVRAQKLMLQIQSKSKH